MDSINKTVFLLLLCICAFGVALGITTARKNEIDVSEITDAVSTVKDGETAVKTVVLKSAIYNLCLLIPVLFAVFKETGTVICGGVFVLKGYAVGFSSACLFMANGFWGGIKGMFGVMLPGCIFLGLLCWLISGFFGDGGIKGRKKRKAKLLYAFKCLAVFCVGVVIQGLLQYGVFYKL